MESNIPVEEAFQFWIGKVLEETRGGDNPLTEIEGRMLEYSQDRQEEMAAVREEFDRQKMGQVFEKKVTTALKARYQRDAQSLGPKGMEAYHHHYKVFKKQPYYLAILVSDALMEEMEPLTLALTTTRENFMRSEKKVNVVPLNALTITAAIIFALWFCATNPMMERWMEFMGDFQKFLFLLFALIVYAPLTLAVRGLIFLIRHSLSRKSL